MNNASKSRIAFYGGSFDPVHRGHLTIGEKLLELFRLDEFVFIPAFHAPHKLDKKVSSVFHRYAMLALATADKPEIKISTIELDAPERPFTIETQTKIETEIGEKTQIFFVIGADSWLDIKTWREWEKVLMMTNIIVVTRPDYEIAFSHITDEIRERIIDLRGAKTFEINENNRIYISDAVNLDISASEIRQKVRERINGWQDVVPSEVVNYIEKYELYI